MGAPDLLVLFRRARNFINRVWPHWSQNSADGSHAELLRLHAAESAAATPNV